MSDLTWTRHNPDAGAGAGAGIIPRVLQCVLMLLLLLGMLMLICGNLHASTVNLLSPRVRA